MRGDTGWLSTPLDWIYCNGNIILNIKKGADRKLQQYMQASVHDRREPCMAIVTFNSPAVTQLLQLVVQTDSSSAAAINTQQFIHRDSKIIRDILQIYQGTLRHTTGKGNSQNTHAVTFKRC